MQPFWGSITWDWNEDLGRISEWVKTLLRRNFLLHIGSFSTAHRRIMHCLPKVPALLSLPPSLSLTLCLSWQYKWTLGCSFYCEEPCSCSLSLVYWSSRPATIWVAYSVQTSRGMFHIKFKISHVMFHIIQYHSIKLKIIFRRSNNPVVGMRARFCEPINISNQQGRKACDRRQQHLGGTFCLSWDTFA